MRAAGLRDAGNNGEEFKLGHQLDHRVPVKISELSFLQVEFHRTFTVDGHKFPVGESPVLEFFQGLFHARPRHLFDMLVDSLQVLVVVEQRDGRFLSNFGDARNVVGSIAKQRLEVGLLGGGESRIAFLQSLFVVDFAVLDAGRQVDPDLG